MKNASAYVLANIASRLIPPKYFSLNRFYVELIFRSSILDNIPNCHVFNDNVDIINFLSSEGTHENGVIDEESNDLELKKSSPDVKIKYENIIPKSVVKSKYFYDLKDRFKKPTNCKTNISTMSVELINMGT